MNKLICDKCNHFFKVKKVKQKIVGVQNSEPVTFHYFECRKCKEKYICRVDTKEINDGVERAKEMQDEYRTLKGTGNVDEMVRLSRQYEALQMVMKALSDEMKGKFRLE